MTVHGWYPRTRIAPPSALLNERKLAKIRIERLPPPHRADETREEGTAATDGSDDVIINSIIFSQRSLGLGISKSLCGLMYYSGRLACA